MLISVKVKTLNNKPKIMNFSTLQKLRSLKFSKPKIAKLQAYELVTYPLCSSHEYYQRQMRDLKHFFLSTWNFFSREKTWKFWPSKMLSSKNLCSCKTTEVSCFPANKTGFDVLKTLCGMSQSFSGSFWWKLIFCWTLLFLWKKLFFGNSWNIRFFRFWSCLPCRIS